ncbi:MAG: enoyl-CoA hydratase/isomerase family protein [Acidimicrobiales bacterium]|nr:enoyl-CoA hydratase/isomerase family protein [Acidimicrobiales bacterium]
MPDPHPADLVTIERDGTTAVVTMNRPERRNALSASMATALVDAFTELHRDRGTRVVVLTGAGPGFCAGADLSGDHDPAPDSEGRGPVGAVYRTQEHLQRAVLAVHECDKPVVAAVHGAAVGGGLALALASDLRVATADARFGAVFHNIGLSACDVGVSYFLPRLVGPGAASELMLTGRIFDGAEADRLGMVNRLVTDGDPIGPARELAERIAVNSEYGVWMTKRGMWLGLDSPSLRHAIELENRTQVLGTFTGNTAVGMAAFMQKRPPEWRPM